MTLYYLHNYLLSKNDSYFIVAGSDSEAKAIHDLIAAQRSEITATDSNWYMGKCGKHIIEDYSYNARKFVENGYIHVKGYPANDTWLGWAFNLPFVEINLQVSE